MHRRISGVYHRLESEADKFASAILLPRSQLIQHVPALYTGLVKIFGFKEPDLILNKIISNLASQYKVSYRAMNIRFEKLKITNLVMEALHYKLPYLDT